MRIVLGNRSLASYPIAGGHWSWFLQYPLGLRALGHDVFWIELMKTSGDRDSDIALTRQFFARLREYDLADYCALAIVSDLNEQDLSRAEVFGIDSAALDERIRTADVMWSFTAAIREPLLSRFRRRVLIDTDPGHLQVLTIGGEYDFELAGYDAYLTVGLKAGDADCEMPTLGYRWRPFMPFVHLPMWEAAPDPGLDAPFTSITQWTWEEFKLGDRRLSASKREAYIPYIDLPRIAGRAFELAVNIGETDPVGDGERLKSAGWRVTDPHRIAATPAAYRDYIRASRGEILCPKPIYRELRTGWFSDRSVCYLASGRPVVAEETGFSDHLPTGRGLIAFTDLAGASDAVRQIDADYAAHSRAARAMATEMFDARKCLAAMLEASG